MKVNGKLLLLSLIITNSILMIMITWSLPQLVQHADGLAAFDMRPTGYHYLEAMALLDALGKDGRKFYLNTQLVIDLFYPLGFMIAYALCCLWLFQDKGRWVYVGYGGAALAVMAGLCDWTENYYIAHMLHAYPGVSRELSVLANIATCSKSIVSSLTFSIIIIGFMLLLWGKIFRDHVNNN